MSRLMSVAYTEDAVRARTKTVTRRKGWWTDKHGRRLIVPGDRLTLCRKVMGRKPGEPLVRICDVEVVAVTRHTLFGLLVSADRHGEIEREGFPGMAPEEFVRRYFVEAQGMDVDDEVTRIEWRYLDRAAG